MDKKDLILYSENGEYMADNFKLKPEISKFIKNLSVPPGLLLVEEINKPPVYFQKITGKLINPDIFENFFLTDNQKKKLSKKNKNKKKSIKKLQTKKIIKY